MGNENKTLGSSDDNLGLDQLRRENERLVALNQQYQKQALQLQTVNNDMDEALNFNRVGIVFLDHNLRICRFTNAVLNFVDIIEADIQQPLASILSRVNLPNMKGALKEALKTGLPLSKDLTLPDGRVVNISVNSYISADLSQQAGLVVAFSDVSRLHSTEVAMEAVYKGLRASINNALETLDTTPLDAQLNVLILDDQAVEIELISAHLRRVSGTQFKLIKATTVDEAMNKLQTCHVDACLIDYNLVGETAVDFIDALEAYDLDPPVIVVTGKLTSELSKLLLSRGALDLIEKDDISPELALRSIRYAIRRKQIDSRIHNIMPEALRAV